MKSPQGLRNRSLRKTKAQLLDEIVVLEQRVAVFEATHGSGAPLRAKRELAEKEAQLRVALNSMPGLLVYTDEDLNIVLFNDRFSEVYQAQREMLQPGQPYPEFLRYLAEQGYFGEGDVDALVAERVESLKNPSSKTFEELGPDGRVRRIRRRRAGSNGTVTVLTDITERKLAEAKLAEKDAQLRVALDNMPGGMMLADQDWNCVFVNAQYSALHDYPEGLLEIGGSTTAETRFQVERGDYGPGDPEKLIEEVDALYRSNKPESYERTLPDGRTLHFNSAPTPDGGYVTIATDISERKRAEEALRESEERFSLAMKGANDGLWDWDLRENEIYVSPYIQTLLGLQLGDRKTTPAEWESRIHPDDLEAYHQSLQANLCGETEFYVSEYRVCDITGTYRWVLDRGAGLRDEAGRVYRMAGSMGDITARKRAEAEVVEKEAQLRVALDNMPGGMEFVDRDWNYVFFNPQYIELHNYPDGLLKVGGSALDETRFQAERGDYGPGDPDKLIEEAHAPFKSGESKSYERTLPSGRTLHFNVAPTPEGGYVTIATDITKRKRAEAELAEKEAHLRVALDNMPGGMALFNRDRNFVLFNSQYCELCDFPDGLIEFGSSMLDELRYQVDRGDFGPGDKDDLIEQVVANYRRGEAVSVERKIASSGRTVKINVAPTPEGGHVSIVTDITDRKRAEAELAGKEAQLRIALDNMPGGMALLDRDWNYVLFNARYNKLFELPDGLVRVGESLRDAMRYQANRGDFGPGDMDELVEQVNTTYPKGETVSYERTIADSGRTLLLSVAPTPEGGYVTIATDITEQKRAEAELAGKEAQLRAALDNMPGGIRLVDGNRNFVLCNQQYIDLYDLPERLLKVGDSIRVENFYCAQRGDLGPGDPETLVDEWLASAPEQTEPSHWEYTLEDGKVLQVRTSPLPDRGVVNVVTDITERKRAEEALLAAKQQAEETSKLIAEKNQMLESLSTQLSKYLSPQVYASIFSGEQSVEITSKRKKLTIFFSDIADFTGITDSLEPEDLTNFLNRYLTEMSSIALAFGATIDKYVGDAIIAFFGNPETRGAKEDARACVNMAIAMQRRMRELHSEWLDMGLEHPFEVRMGINTGYCTVGNFGSKDRMDYTIIGNEVNLAARLESQAEIGGILLAHKTYSLVKDTVLAEESEAVTVKGFSKQVRTYSVVGLYDDLASQGRIIRKEQGAVRVLIDLKKGDKAEAILAIKDVLSQLEG